MSPVLFNGYMDDLSVFLNNSKVGCSTNGVISNHIMDADHVLLLLHHLHYTNCMVCMLTLLTVILLNIVRVKPNVCVLSRRNYQAYMPQGSC